MKKLSLKDIYKSKRPAKSFTRKETQKDKADKERELEDRLKVAKYSGEYEEDEYPSEDCSINDIRNEYWRVVGLETRFKKYGKE